MRETGTVVNYNGYEGEIKNENGNYALLKDNVYGADRDDITIGSEVEFSPKINKSSVGEFLIAENVTIISKEQRKKTARVRIFRPRTKRG